MGVSLVPRALSPLLDSDWRPIQQETHFAIRILNHPSFILIFNYGWRWLGKPPKQIFGKSWDFGPTGFTPPPLPERWDSQKGKKKVMFILHFRLF